MKAQHNQEPYSTTPFHHFFFYRDRKLLKVFQRCFLNMGFFTTLQGEKGGGEKEEKSGSIRLFHTSFILN